MNLALKIVLYNVQQRPLGTQYWFSVLPVQYLKAGRTVFKKHLNTALLLHWPLSKYEISTLYVHVQQSTARPGTSTTQTCTVIFRVSSLQSVFDLGTAIPLYIGNLRVHVRKIVCTDIAFYQSTGCSCTCSVFACSKCSCSHVYMY